MKNILIITEKKDVAIPMAAALKLKAGSYCFTGNFKGDNVKIIWASGHLLTFESPDVINPGLGWNNPHGLKPLPRAMSMVPSKGDNDRDEQRLKNLMKNISDSLRACDEVVMATDADREGEFIGWSILEHFNSKKLVKRCWLAAGTDETSVLNAMNSLLPAESKRSLARAAEARARCDYPYMFIVRLMTFYGRQGALGPHLGSGKGRESVVSLGRVQSASLYMLYNREMDIRNFKPKTFYKIFGDFLPGGINLQAEYKPKVTQAIIDSVPEGVSWEPQGGEGDNKLDRPLFTGVPQVKAFKERLMANAAQAVVMAYEEGIKESHPPITFDLVAAKSELINACNITGDQAQCVIEDLYGQGFISYPRTAHGELPMNLNVPAERDTRLSCLVGLPQLADAANRAIAIHNGKDSQYKVFKPKVFVNKPLEHYGLIPSPRKVNAQILANITPQKMLNNRIAHTSEHMKVAYMLIAERFVQAMLPPAKIATQKITFSVPTVDLLGHPASIFTANAERTVDPGWKGIMKTGADKESDLPKLARGSSAPLHKLNVKEGKTKAPGRYNEKNWEAAMQTAARQVSDPELRKYMASGTNKPEGIGTPATRQTIIPTLKARAYVRADKSNVYFLEPKGEDLINFLIKHEHHKMYRIETTAEWEGKLSEMAMLTNDGEACKLREQFVEENLQDLEGLIDWMNDRYSGAQRQQSKDFTLSPAQKGFLEKVEAACGVKATDEERGDRFMIKAFIDKHKGALDAQAPSEKMAKYAKDLAAKLPPEKQPPATVFTIASECRAFIDKHAAPRSAGKTAASGAKKSTSAVKKTASAGGYKKR